MSEVAGGGEENREQVRIPPPHWPFRCTPLKGGVVHFFFPVVLLEKKS